LCKEVKEKLDLANEMRKNPWQAPPRTHMEPYFVKRERVIEGLKPG
jgi:hypothetical protein